MPGLLGAIMRYIHIHSALVLDACCPVVDALELFAYVWENFPVESHAARKHEALDNSQNLQRGTLHEIGR